MVSFQPTHKKPTIEYQDQEQDQDERPDLNLE